MSLVYSSSNPLCLTSYAFACRRSSHTIYIFNLCHQRQLTMYKQGKSVFSGRWRFVKSFPILTYLRDRYCPSSIKHVCVEYIKKPESNESDNDLISLKLSNAMIMHSVITHLVCVIFVSKAFLAYFQWIEINNWQTAVVLLFKIYFNTTAENHIHTTMWVSQTLLGKADKSYYISSPCHKIHQTPRYALLTIIAVTMGHVSTSGGGHDAKPNCLDSSDETGEAHVCHLHTSVTRNTLSGNFTECSVCQLGNCTCSAHYYQCPSGGCVPWKKVCDGVYNCHDISDEAYCNANTKYVQYVPL